MIEESILDQIIESQHNQGLVEFNPKGVLENLTKNLSDREHEVISLRYGLKVPEKKTLEEIGKKFQVTRERIRQIENSALKKMKSHDGFETTIKPVEKIVKQTLEEHGGIMHHEYLIDRVLINLDNNLENRYITSFIINYLLGDRLAYSDENEEIYSGWKLPAIELTEINEILQAIISALVKHNEPLTLEQIINKLSEASQDLSNKINESQIISLLVISKKIEKNPFNEWGLTTWQTITPKRMSDKIYLVLKKAGEPMHFTKIAERINEIGFDSKKANPATIHNELILDNKYVLVGRGIYALKEWGYQPGVVADVIEQIIKQAGPLTRDEIIEKVLEKRHVKRSTIILALMNKKRFTKDANKRYNIAEDRRL